ncbi:putative nucleotide-binding alpha-beta plait domain-containing protein [Medicago truncatula]|nr:U2 small nuclear ribonucleoprotein B'' 2 [Medicago truncatula]RHN79396.1 putative nucleotide-binding alpha-beta plait domain-containing protein [Medicago truncatula]
MVCFSEVTAASNAVRQMQNFPFYVKPMRIQYTKTKSDCVSKEEGSFVPREKKKKQEEKAEKKWYADESKQSAVPNGTHGASNGGSTQASFCPGSGAQEAAAPNNILFIENLPYETTGRMLEMLFEQYPGFKEVRLIEAKPGIAFVDFEDEGQSSMAMQALQGFKITPQNPMIINFAKK